MSTSCLVGTCVSLIISFANLFRCFICCHFGSNATSQDSYVLPDTQAQVSSEYPRGLLQRSSDPAVWSHKFYGDVKNNSVWKIPIVPSTSDLVAINSDVYHIGLNFNLFT